jgi:hypothetical protein
MRESLRYRGRIDRQLFLKAHLVHLAARWWVSVLILVLFPVLMGVLAFSRSFEGVDPWWVSGWSLTFPIVMVALQYWQWMRLYRRSAWLADPIEGELSDEGMTIRYANASSDLKWELFARARRSQDLLLLYQAPHAFNILSRKFFDSEEEWHRAVDLVKARLGPSRSWGAA